MRSHETSRRFASTTSSARLIALAAAAVALPGLRAFAVPPPTAPQATAPAAGSARATDAYLDATGQRWEKISKQVWDYAETGLKESRSAELLEGVLEGEGFAVKKGVAQMPTAFVATAGSGGPVVGYLVEYDALPGLSQAAGQAQKSPVAQGAPGHGCGHNLLGTAALAAAVAANKERIDKKLPGTIKVFGTPAEELDLGKVFMMRDGVFDGTDAVLSWHPDDKNEVVTKARLALTVTEVEFFGKSAHAAKAPWLGRGALDGVEVLEHAVSLMREHVLPSARIHRVIKDGGAAANIISDHATVQIWLRDQNGKDVDEMLGRLRKAAEGAALATETKARLSILSATRDALNNTVLGRIFQKHLERVGPPQWDAQDDAFARALQKEVGAEPSGLATTVLPFAPGHGGTASSDLAEVSWAMPLAELEVATRPIGTASHHWGQTSCAAHPLGRRGMMVAAKVLAASGVDLLGDPGAVAAAKAELAKATQGKPYVSPLAKDARPQVY